MSKSSKAQDFATGFGLYYLICWCIAFYPALIFSIWVANMSGEPDDPVTCFGGFILYITFSFIIKIMIKFLRQTWPVLLFVYGITLYPFLKLVQWSGTSPSIPWSGLDWFPW